MSELVTSVYPPVTSATPRTLARLGDREDSRRWLYRLLWRIIQPPHW